MLSALRKTHQGVAVATSGETLSHQVMCLECFFQLRGFVESKFLPLRLGLDKRERHCPKMLHARREFVNGLRVQAGRPCCGNVLFYCADTDVPVTVEQLCVCGLYEETVGDEHVTSRAQERSKALEQRFAGDMATAIHRHGGVKTVFSWNFQRVT